MLILHSAFVDRPMRFLCEAVGGVHGVFIHISVMLLHALVRARSGVHQRHHDHAEDTADQKPYQESDHVIPPPLFNSHCEGFSPWQSQPIKRVKSPMDTLVLAPGSLFMKLNKYLYSIIPI